MAGVCETVGTQEHSDRACAAACHSLARPYLDLLIRGHCFRGRTNSFDLEIHATLPFTSARANSAWMPDCGPAMLFQS